MAISLYELSQRISSSMPLGTIVPYYGTDEPSGWKICDGRSCAGSELAKKLGISNVPDLRGRFLRMIGGNAAGMAVAQGDCIRNITGVCNSPAENQYAGVNPSGAFFHGGFIASVGGHEFIVPGLKFDASRVVPTGPENRPINTAFNYIIKVNTNVILYYVSNIIYKAIAIGKSLLSRAKEEVRRTMAISLSGLNNTANNHESRIKALENKTSSSGKMVELWNGGHGGGNLTISNHNFDDYAIIIGHCDCAGAGSYEVMHYSTNLFCPTNRYGARSNCFCDLGGDDAAGMYLVNNHTINFTAWAGVWLQHVYGLKLYYNFSYNIYRLTQILFDSSLLGLFSQKGGARTI